MYLGNTDERQRCFSQTEEAAVVSINTQFYTKPGQKIVAYGCVLT